MPADQPYFTPTSRPLTSARPARSGETLILRATGLRPTRPGLAPGVPFSLNSILEVDSPVEVVVNGRSADVLNKIRMAGNDLWTFACRMAPHPDPQRSGLRPLSFRRARSGFRLSEEGAAHSRHSRASLNDVCRHPVPGIVGSAGQRTRREKHKAIGPSLPQATHSGVV